ncbi:hypothetical protein BJX62DRAFT_205905 [Aspergillus germanicus]
MSLSPALVLITPFFLFFSFPYIDFPLTTSTVFVSTWLNDLPTYTNALSFCSFPSLHRNLSM